MFWKYCATTAFGRGKGSAPAVLRTILLGFDGLTDTTCAPQAVDTYERSDGGAASILQPFRVVPVRLDVCAAFMLLALGALCLSIKAG